jgi:GTPase
MFVMADELQKLNEATERITLTTNKPSLTCKQWRDEDDIAEYFEELKELSKAQGGDAVVPIGFVDTGKGLTKNESERALALCTKVADEHNQTLSVICTVEGDQGVYQECLLRANAEPDDFVEVRVAVTGQVDSGKSTILGVLTHNKNDNGRGLARQMLLKHDHEKETGQTSSVTHNILGFDNKGAVVNKPDHQNRLDWTEICFNSSKVVTFVDLAGHEKYLKTTALGMTGHHPDYVKLVVGANAGVQHMTKEHMKLALGLDVPMFVVVTKIDMAPEAVFKQNLKHLMLVLKSPGCRKTPLVMKTVNDLPMAYTGFHAKHTTPVFITSNVTGEGLDLLRSFLNLLVPMRAIKADEEPTFQIDEIFSVPGIGTVVSGTVLSGVFRVGDKAFIGPNAAGGLVAESQIRSIHRHRLPVQHLSCGDMGTFALKKVERSLLSRGQVIYSSPGNTYGVFEFLCHVIVLAHRSTITVGYQTQVHVGSVRCTARIISISCGCLRSGESGFVRFVFLRGAQFVSIGERFVLREGTSKGVGEVVDIYPERGRSGLEKLLAQQKGRRQRKREQEQLDEANAIDDDKELS